MKTLLANVFAESGMLLSGIKIYNNLPNEYIKKIKLFNKKSIFICSKFVTTCFDDLTWFVC